jgi:hypothetical protein
VLLAAAALVINGILAWRAELRLQSRLAEIRAAGDPASIAEMAPPAIPDEEDAAAIMERIRPRLDEFSREYGKFYNSPLGRAYDEAGGKGEAATKEQIDAMQAILAKYADVEIALKTASECEHYASRLDFSLNHPKFLEQLMDRIQNGRTAARLLAWRGEVLLADGQHEEALIQGMRALRLARLHENEPTLVAFLVAVAMRGAANGQIYDALAAGSVSAELHAALDQELARQDDPKNFARVLKAERAICCDWLYGQFDDNEGFSSWRPGRVGRIRPISGPAVARGAQSARLG